METINSVKNWTKILINKIRYPTCQIEFGSQIKNGTTLGDNAIIKRKAFIVNSKLGNGVKVHENCTISNSCLENNITIYNYCSLSNVFLGKFSYIAQNSQLNLTKLGKFCSIGPYLICGYGEHPTNFISTNPIFFSTYKQCGVTFASKSFFQELKEITIGHDVWIGARVFIKDGIKIGNGAVIAAGAVVVKDVPDYAIVGGIPAKIIRFRFSEEIIQELLNIQWWNWSEEKLQAAQKFFIQKDMTHFIEWAKIQSINMSAGSKA